MAHPNHSHRLPQPVLRLRPNSEADNTRKETIRAKRARENARDSHNYNSAPSELRVDIGPAYHPRFAYRKSWELESPEQSEPGSPTEIKVFCPDLGNFAKRSVSTQGQKSPPEESEPVSPLESPVPSGAGSAVSSMSSQTDDKSLEKPKSASPTKIPVPSPTGSWASTRSTQSSTQTDEEAKQPTPESTKEIDDATLRASNLSEQLLMERSKLLTVSTELEETAHLLATLTHDHSILLKEHENTKHLLWTTRHRLNSAEKQRKGLFSSEKLALVQAERDAAVLQTSEMGLKIKKAEQEKAEAEKERDEAVAVAAHYLEEKEKMRKAKDQARALLVVVLEEKRGMRREKMDLDLRIRELSGEVEDLLVRIGELEEEVEAKEKKRNEAILSADYNLVGWVSAQKSYEEQKQEAELWREEVVKMRGEKKAWTGYWPSIFGSWWD